MHPTLSQQSAHDRSKPVGEPHASYDEQAENVIHETGCSQFVRTIMAHHKRIGESHHDGAQLPQHDRNADAQKVGIV